MGALPASAQILQSPDEIALARTGPFARDSNVGVLDRPRPEYDPLGITLGSFKLQPELDLGLEYNTNIYAVPNNTTGDEIFHISPAAVLNSNWNRNQVQLYGRGSFNEYFDHSSENTANYIVGGQGRLDIQNNFGLAGGASIEHDSESRTSPNSPVTAKSPVEYDLVNAFGVGAYQFSRLRLSARVDYTEYSYDNATSVSGASLYQKDRDYRVVSGTFRAEYAARPGTSVFANLVIDHEDNLDLLPTDISRTNSGYELTVGSNFDITHLIKGEVFVGYLDQSFDDSRYKDVSGVSLRGYVKYYWTGLTTVTLSGTRTPVNSVITGSGAYLNSNVSVRLDHELLRNLILSGVVTYENDDYSGISRTDNRNYESLTATYLMNRRVGLNFTYQHSQNRSSGTLSGLSYDDNSITAGVILRY